MTYKQQHLFLKNELISKKIIRKVEYTKTYEIYHKIHEIMQTLFHNHINRNDYIYINNIIIMK